MIDELFVLAETVKTPEIKNHTIDGVSAIAALVIASFAVDRVAKLGLFCISFIPALADADRPDNQAQTGLPPQRKLIRFIYFVLATAAALAIASFGDMGILESLGFKRASRTETHHFFDLGLTVIILTAGADRISQLIQATTGASVGPDQHSANHPVEISGTLTLDPETQKHVSGDNAD